MTAPIAGAPEIPAADTSTGEHGAPEAFKAPRGRRVLIALGMVVAAILVLNLAARGLDQAVGGNQPKGESGSSYATNAGVWPRTQRCWRATATT